MTRSFIFLRYILKSTVICLTILFAHHASAASNIPLVDNQPTATDSCDFSNSNTTESADGTMLGVRQYGCSSNAHYVVFTVTIPKACKTVSCGLILDIHGATMNAAEENAGTKLQYYGWKAPQYGASTPYIVIQPNLTNLFDTQNDTLDPLSVMGGAYNNELPIISQFVNNVIQALHVDNKRIHVHGFSRGAQTANVFYCNNSSLYASYAMTGGEATCAITRPLMMTNGLTDPNVTLAAAVTAAFAANPQTVTSVVAEDPSWQTPNLTYTSSGWVPVGKQSHKRYTQGSLILENVKHSGASYPLAGHCLPVTTPPGWLVCQDTFNLGENLINFFIQNPKR
ncbi:MAG: hypothetical protein KGO49_07990 [Gammaproteobacteria bacterium]|nr:hypothetical protein [Gammaproteobacteria bacterium]